MILYPAIDLLDGRVVRLHKGAFDAVTDYGDDPVAVAEAFGEAGASWVHVVDLAGARDGARRQSGTIRAICQTGLRVQTGGGVRSAQDIESLLAIGVERVIIGSLAVTDAPLRGPEHHPGARCQTSRRQLSPGPAGLDRHDDDHLARSYRRL